MDFESLVIKLLQEHGDTCAKDLRVKVNFAGHKIGRRTFHKNLDDMVGRARVKRYLRIKTVNNMPTKEQRYFLPGKERKYN